MSVPYCFYPIVGNNFTWMETNFCNCNTITFSAHDSVFWRRMYFIKNNQKLCHFIHRSVDTLLCSIRVRIKGVDCRQRVSLYLVMKCWPGNTNCMCSHTPAILSIELQILWVRNPQWLESLWCDDNVKEDQIHHVPGWDFQIFWGFELFGYTCNWTRVPLWSCAKIIMHDSG